MKKTKLLIILMMFLIIFAVSACGKKEQPKTADRPEELVGEESYFSTSVVQMFKKNKPLECHTSMENIEGIVRAVYYFDNENERVRIDMEVIDKNSGMNIETKNIVKDGWSYFWDNFTNKDGMKVKFEDFEDEKAVDSFEENIPAELKDDFDFKCKSWKVDSAIFDLPKDKSFKDLTDMINNFGDYKMPASGDSGGFEMPPAGDRDGLLMDVCIICEMVPVGPERDDCLSSCQ